MVEPNEHFFLLAVILYLGISHLFLVSYIPSFLRKKIDTEKNPEIVKNAQRQERISFTLTGFALIALVFIIGSFKDNLAEVEIIIALFSLGFLFEIISSSLYHFITRNVFMLSGLLFQYGGIFAIMLGFFAYLSSAMGWSFYVLIIYSVGTMAFVILTIKEIQIYLDAYGK